MHWLLMDGSFATLLVPLAGGALGCLIVWLLLRWDEARQRKLHP